MKRGVSRTSEVALAVAVLLVVWVLSTNVPVEYPTWPTVGEVPINPELVVPGALAAVVIANALGDGLGLWSVGIGLLGAVTLFLSLTSLYTLYAATGGCVFFGGILTLAAGIPLSLLVLGKRVSETIAG